MQIFTSFFYKKKNRWISIAVLVLCVAVLVVTLSQTALAQTTYVIMDGDQVTHHTTYTSNPEKVLSEAGFTLDTDDFYITEATDHGPEIRVQRVQDVTVQYCGSELNVKSASQTVGQLLQEQGIPVGGEYVVSVPEETPVKEGMEITVSHVVNSEETYTVEIPFETSVLYDDTMAEGQEKILVPGVSGQMQRKADVVYVDTLEQSRTVLEENVLQEPVEQVKVVGTGENAGAKRTKPLIGNGVIVLPSGEVLTYSKTAQFKATAYTQIDDVTDTTATGTKVREGVVAVDPKVIPYGTRMFVVTNDGEFIYGLSTAEDCGGGIKGNRLDLYFDTLAQCYQFGVRDCTVYFLGDANWR